MIAIVCPAALKFIRNKKMGMRKLCRIYDLVVCYQDNASSTLTNLGIRMKICTHSYFSYAHRTYDDCRQMGKFISPNIIGHVNGTGGMYHC